jgi:hypothetical protein
MRKVLILLSLVAFVMGSMAYATDTRVISMGEVNGVVKDNANIWMYPSTINYYPNIFLGEVGDQGLGGTKADYDEMCQVGAHFGFGQDGDKPWVLGAYFSDDPYYHDIVAWWDKTEIAADQRINLFYGRNLGEMPFGFFLGYYSDGDKNEDEDETVNYEDGLSRYEFMFGLSPMEGKLDVSFGIAMTSWTDKDYRVYGANSGLVDISKPTGNMDIGGSVRYWMDPMGNCTLVPHLSFAFLKQGLEEYGADGDNWVLYYTYETSETLLDLGIGMNYEADEDVLVVTDFGITLDNWKWEETEEAIAGGETYEETDNYLLLPYFKLGIDAYVVKWLDFRAGVVNQWVKNTWEPDFVADESEKRVYSWAETWTYLGAGVHWGDLSLDAIIAPEFITNGPYFISGEDTDGEWSGLAGQVSLLYNFD